MNTMPLKDAISQLKPKDGSNDQAVFFQKVGGENLLVAASPSVHSNGDSSIGITSVSRDGGRSWQLARNFRPRSGAQCIISSKANLAPRTLAAIASVAS